ncbi:MAG: tRNA dihydrouridine synthase DusB [Candidatus Cloacimonetes bacterium]|nr:tRNA dihydrouridine synthase DusB [Candidatus Cloacimonadota bacterium]
MINDLFKQPLLFLAPLAGYTDQAFRLLCKSMGAEVMVSEMVSADGLIRDSAKTVQFAIFTKEEQPFGIQIFGSDPLVMAKAAEFLLPFKPDFIDVNMGCPVKKVIKRGAGSALMQTPLIAETIVKEVQKALSGTIPLSVKFRSGADNNDLNYLDFGKRMEASGADFICLHPRTVKQMFSGKSNWVHIKELKANLSIPLIGNGDVSSPEDAKQMLSETNCDGVMIGRGALGKPWIFRQSRQMLDTNNYDPITKDLLLTAIFSHIDLALRFKPERVVVKEMRSQICFYTKGLLGGAELRNRINHTESMEELKSLLTKALTSSP